MAHSHNNAHPTETPKKLLDIQVVLATDYTDEDIALLYSGFGTHDREYFDAEYERLKKLNLVRQRVNNTLAIKMFLLSDLKSLKSRHENLAKKVDRFNSGISRIYGKKSPPQDHPDFQRLVK